MIQSKELKYLVENAIYFFKKGSETNDKYYEDVAWDYARGILENMLDENKKQDLYSRLVKKLNKEYNKLKISFFEEHKIKFSNYTIDNVSEEKKEAILLFLMDWNYIRFIQQVRRSDNSYDYSKLKEYIEKFLQAIDTIILSGRENISDKPYKDAFEYVKDNCIRKNEYVATAKILMLLDPDKFIAWDTKIAERFNLRHNDRDNSKHDYERFNDLINKFIERDNAVAKNMEDYAKEYIGNNNSYKIRKLLDMMFWITYNRKNVPLKFYCYTEKLVEEHIATNLNSN